MIRRALFRIVYRDLKPWIDSVCEAFLHTGREVSELQARVAKLEVIGRRRMPETITVTFVDSFAEDPRSRADRARDLASKRRP